MELVKLAGFPYEVHDVQTEDGYILKLHRIMPRKPGFYKKGVIFLMHGMVRSSTDYALTGADNALSFLLSDSGYDVWMGNARGNTFSTKHRFLSPDDQKFWDFSYHEMGYFDLSAMISYTLQETREPNLFYAGHSQGGAAVLALLSTRPEFNAKIRQLHLMAPAVYLTNIKFPFAFQVLELMVSLLTDVAMWELLEVFSGNASQDWSE